MFGRKKTTYRFDLMQSDTIQPEMIKTADELINYVIGVNQYLQEKNETGWLFIEKIKESKKESLVLYVAKLELPIIGDNHYFDRELAPFYTRKKVPYDKTLVSPLSDEFLNSAATPELPDSLGILADKGAVSLNQEFIKEVEEKIVAQESIEAEPLAVEESNSIAQQQFADVMLIVKKQQEEIDYLKALKQEELMNEELAPMMDSTIDSPPVDFVEEIFSSTEEPESLVVHSDSPPILSDYPGDSVVTDVLDMVKNEFSTRLSSFVAEEMKKISEEIKQLDTRESIEPSVTKRIEEEKNRVIESESALLEAKKNLLIKEEKQRHDTNMTAIDQSYLKDKDEKLSEILVSYETKLKREIREEYLRQTDQLSRILQGKKEELSLRQADLNAGLKNNFAQVLASFNENHEQVIQQIDKQKEQNTLIDFSAHLKQA